MINNYRVATIDSKLAKMVVEKKHYLHRKPTTRFCFGLFDNQTLLGVLILSQPASPNVVKSVLGKDNLHLRKQLIELNRLWVDDVCP